MATTRKIIANGTEISVLLKGSEDDYICLTDMARYKDKQRTDYIIQNWMRSRSTIEYLGVWEQLHNPNFNPIEFDGFRNQAGLYSFSFTPKKWACSTSKIQNIALKTDEQHGDNRVTELPSLPKYFSYNGKVLVK